MKKNISNEEKIEEKIGERFEPFKIEPKWQKVWEEKKTFKVDIEKAKRPFYNLAMFPYPSAEGLHVGHIIPYSGSDTFGRFMRMKGFDVFEPMGFDAFGIHSENFAIKKGIHPATLTAQTTKYFKDEQMKRLGTLFDWDRMVDTSTPEYYKWTQWIFVQMFKAGLAIRKKALVNWCPSCKTVLSDEQVINGACERCKTIVTQKEMEQWFFKITKYSNRLLKNLDWIDWSKRTIAAQRNWIGKSEGAIIKFKVPLQGKQSSKFKVNEVIEVFTTRPDTLGGATFLVIAPENPFAAELQKSKIKNQKSKIEIEEYIEKAKKKTEQERISEGWGKTGVFSGIYAINPLTKEEIPIWIADYVVMGYGSGAIMGVPAHDQRDYDFAKKYSLPIRKVIEKEPEAKNRYAAADRFLGSFEVYDGEGEIVNSGEWDGWKYPKDLEKIIDWLEKNRVGEKKTTYKLRDWCISRQRYWGPPIPMIYCEKCGWQPVPEKDLPVLLPKTEDYLPDGSGKSPLARISEFVNTKCPHCGGKAERETDVSDTFLDSSWYFLRYPSTRSARSGQVPFDPEITRKWLPVDMYIGGNEHAVLHLMYARFVTMALKDMGYIDFEEPFKRFFAHGLLIKDGAKMSKSRGNVVNPNIYLDKYGADTLRMYILFLGPYDGGGDFRDTGIAGMYRFLGRVWRWANNEIKNQKSRLQLPSATDDDGQAKITCKFERIYSASKNQKQILNVKFDELDKSDKLWRSMQRLIKGVSEDLENLRFNTAIAKMMEFLNIVTSLKDTRLQLPSATADGGQASNKLGILENYLLLLAPLAPHLSEELFQELRKVLFPPSSSSAGLRKGFQSVHDQKWPVFDEKMLVEDEVTIVIQVNGKLRDRMGFKNYDLRFKNKKEEVIEMARKSEKVKKFLEGKKILKEIYVPLKLVNFVVE